jgi:1-acyl-sn-glycerol-3-phosphate acyltransferase
MGASESSGRAPRTGRIDGSSPLLGGPLPSHMPAEMQAEAGAEEQGFVPGRYDESADLYGLPSEPAAAPPLTDLSKLLPEPDSTRQVDDWGRSERIYDLMEPVLNFYYRYWFRVSVEGIEHVPASGGALLSSNHSGALPPDAPMIVQAIRNEHPVARPVYMLGENWFRSYPGVGMLANKIGMVSAHPANANRLLREEGRLVLVFPEGQKGTSKLYWQRYKLRRFGRGGFVKTAIRAGVPIVPIAVMGAEEAMPIFAHVPLLQRLTGLIYFPINHAFPHFGPLAAGMYMPAKFRIRFLEPVRFDEFGPDAADDVAFVQQAADDVRTRIQNALNEMLGERRSVWFG